MCFYRSTIKDAKLWSVKSPTLYTVTVDVMDSSSGKLLDSTNYSVGVRTLVYSNKGLTLNDEVQKRLFCAVFYAAQTEHLPSQARDKHIYQARLGTNTGRTHRRLVFLQAVKVRGFCDHSNFAGVGGAVPDRVNLYRVQMLRSVGGNAWRMVRARTDSY